MTTINTYAAATVGDISSLWLDRATIIGLDVAYAAYGIHVALFFLCFNHLWTQRKRRPRRTYAWLAYISALFILGSVSNGIDMHMGQVIFVDNRNFPGGPGAFASTIFTVPVNIICTAACVIGGWLQDALLIFRFYVIVSPVWWLLAVPICMFTVSIVMSCLLLAQLTHPGSTIWQRTNVNIELAYWCTTIVTNILLTVLIVAHLVHMRRKVAGALGKQTRVPYLTVSAMFIEAAFLYTAFGVAFLVPYAMGNTFNVLFFSLIGQIQYITPLLIILRVAQDRAYTRQGPVTEPTATSTIRWARASGNQPHTIGTDIEARVTVQHSGDSVSDRESYLPDSEKPGPLVLAEKDDSTSDFSVSEDDSNVVMHTSAIAS
ncbi:hypothetical protein EUX98_g4015 [Antrodiella citrinella]|uniref:G-protein coupled receptors family 1 profile domain-containing protein n=1 Tax=Antrodiella citrinella TaxID=2447956 RepID=A0A4S4MXW8_9APHY|nr:hypothetical protein EUX98_g4015 [Antrodiella citrinella]